MLDLRLYRASLLPFVVAALVAAFSFASSPAPRSSTLPPDAFNGTRAFSGHGGLEYLARHFPDRTPGSPGDDALAAYVADQLQADGFAIQPTLSASASTLSGHRRITTVIATRPGNGGAIVIVAHRDATADPAEAALSGTAVQLELAIDLSQRTSQRPLVFVSTSGGSGGDAGAAIAAAALQRPIDAVIVIGDVAGTQARRPYVVGWSGDGGVASAVLTGTLNHALAAQIGQHAGGVSLLAQLSRFALPIAVSEQAPFDDAGYPAVLVQQSGELGPPSAHEPVSMARQTNFGRGILDAVNALEVGAAVPAATTRYLTLAANTFGGWIVRLLVGLAILSSAGCTLDVLARARRRKIAIARWGRWLLGWAAPFFAAGLFAKLLAWSGVLSPVPPAAVTPRQLPLSGSGDLALASVLVVFVLACLARAFLARRLRLDGSDATAGAPVALLSGACLLAIVLWIVNPYSAALLALPLALWLVVMTRERRHSRALGALYVLCSLAPLALAFAVEAHELALGPLGFAWTWLLVFAGGEVGIGGLLACSLAGGIAVAAALILLHPSARGKDDAARAITVRGPASYAGPGSLGGTDSALRPRPQ